MRMLSRSENGARETSFSRVLAACPLTFMQLRGKAKQVVNHKDESTAGENTTVNASPHKENKPAPLFNVREPTNMVC